MPDVATCPDLPSLRRFLLGPCAAEEKEALAKHLEQCNLCMSLLHTIQDEHGNAEAMRSHRDAGEQAGAASPGDATIDAVSQAPQEGTLPPSSPPSLPQASDQATLPPSPASREPGADVTLSRALPSSAGTPGETTDALYDFLAPPQNPGELGRLGPYHVLKVLGAGGMGVVFQAHDPHLERSVALKAMLPSLAASAGSKQRFLREAKAAAAIKHDHIVTIYQVGEDRGVPFLAMEFLEGESLDDRLKREGKLWPHEVLRIGRELAEGLAAAHKRGLIHRDVKPGNVWLEGDRARVKILDFGLVRLASDDGDPPPADGAAVTRTFTDNVQLTQAGAIVGTPAFMAPEQADGKPVDARCDLFSLGCVLYQAATGKLPFQGRNMISTLMAVTTETPPSPEKLNPDLPPELSVLVMQLLAKDPAERPASASRVVWIIHRIEALAQKRTAEGKVREAADSASYAALTADRVAALPAVEHGLVSRPSKQDGPPAAPPSPPAPPAAPSWLRRHRVLVAGIIALALAPVCVLLHFLNNLLALDRAVPSHSPVLRQNWLPILFLLTLTVAFIAYCVYRRVVGLAPLLSWVGSVAVVILLWASGLFVIGALWFVVIPRPPAPLQPVLVGPGTEQNLAVPPNIPDLISYQPQQPPTACIAVQATREDFELFAARNSELVVVLDYSGSMNTPQPNGQCRIDKVLDALKECLTKLPTGVRLSVVTFQTDDKGIAPVIITQRESTPWQPNQATDLIDRLSRLPPQGNTPLLRALAGCPAHFSSNFKGAKTIVVLTDGGDNMFHATDGAELRKDGETMKKFLHSRFDGSGILVHVIGFQLDELRKNPAANKDELEGLEEFVPAIKDVGGTFTVAEKADDLTNELQRYLYGMQILFWVEDERDNPIITTAGPNGKDSLHITLDTDNVRPSFRVKAPESYYVHIQAYSDQDRTWGKLLKQHVYVEPGEALILDLKNAANKDGQFDLRRDLYAKSHGIGDANAPVVEPIPVGKDWMLTILGNTKVQNKVTPRDAREITLSVEGTDDSVPRTGTVRQARPKLVWFNVAKEGDKQPIPWLRFYPMPNYPSPVWRLELDESSGGALVLDAWWCEDSLPEGMGLLLRKGREFQNLSDLKGQSFNVRPTVDEAPTQVVVERVGIERRAVEVQPGKPQFLECLVVNLRYPEGRPYFVQLPDGFQPLGGYEQRFDALENQYTGEFFGVSAPQAANLAWLKLISVEEVHRKAIRVDGVAIRRDGAPPLPIDK